MSLFHFGDSAEGRGRDTVVAQLDPRVQLVCAGALALWIGLLPEEQVGLAGVLGVGLVIVGMVADIPPGTLLLRASGVVPFVLIPVGLGLLGGTADPRHAAAMVGRGCATALVATLLVNVTSFGALLAGASALGVPDVLVQTTALVYRYLSVLRERAGAMVASAQARGWSRRTPDRIRVAGAMLGVLLVRSLDRGERVHRSMLARGYTGRLPSLRPLAMTPIDWAVGIGVVAAAAGSAWALR